MSKKYKLFVDVKDREWGSIDIRCDNFKDHDLMFNSGAMSSVDPQWDVQLKYAEHIVKCVNNHDALMEALKDH